MKKVIALDIGGTNTRVALINEKYETEKILIKPTEVGNLDIFLESIVKIIKEAIPDYKKEAVCIAAGVPGRVRHDGYIYALPNVHVEQIPLAAYLHEKLGLPCYVRNDAEVAALSEANLGAYKAAKSLYFVTVSTGVGGALTIGGKLVNSSYEVGHTMFAYKGEIHEFEHMASGTGICRLCDKNGLSVSSAKDFFALVENKHPEALRVYHDWINLMASFIKMVYDAFTPEVFTFTGGVFKSDKVFWKDLEAACPGINIKKCSFSQEAGLVGAAVYGFQMMEGK